MVKVAVSPWAWMAAGRSSATRTAGRRRMGLPLEVALLQDPRVVETMPRHDISQRPNRDGIARGDTTHGEHRLRHPRKQCDGRAPDRLELGADVRDVPLVGRRGCRVRLFVETGQGGLLAAGEAQRPGGEDALSVVHVPDQLRHAPLGRLVAEGRPPLRDRLHQRSELHALPGEDLEEIPLRHLVDVLLIVRIELACLRTFDLDHGAPRGKKTSSAIWSAILPVSPPFRLLRTMMAAWRSGNRTMVFRKPEVSP